MNNKNEQELIVSCNDYVKFMLFMKRLIDLENEIMTIRLNTYSLT